MATLAEIRAQYPQYDDMSDADLASAMHAKFYSDMPREEFDRKVGLAPQEGGGIAEAAARGLIEGIPVVGPAIGKGARMTAAGIRSLMYDTPYREELKAVEGYDQGTLKKNPVASSLGEMGGAVAGTVPMVMAAPAAFGVGGGGLLLRSLASGASGAALGGADAAVRSGGDIDATVQGTGMGAGFGLAGPAASSVISNIAGRVISPFRMNPERARAAANLAQEGVETTAGQRTGSRPLRYAEGEIGGRSAENIMERQGDQFTSAALRRAGVTDGRATPDVIDNAFSRIGQQFDDLAARNTLVPDRKFVDDLVNSVNEYQSLVPESMRAPIVMDTIRDLNGSFKSLQQIGQSGFSGDAYQALRSRLERAARGANADPQLSSALRGIRTALDDAMERSIMQTNPADLGGWKDARRLYRNMLTIEKATSGAGENAALGIISPSHLRNAAVQQGRRAYVRGQGDFAELARSGEAIMKPLPQSGTAPRLSAQNLGMSIVPALAGATAGGSYGATEGGINGAIFGALAGAAVPRGVGAAMMTRPGQAFLANQLGNRAAPQIQQLVRAILAASPPIANQAQVTRY